MDFDLVSSLLVATRSPSLNMMWAAWRGILPIEDGLPEPITVSDPSTSSLTLPPEMES